MAFINVTSSPSTVPTCLVQAISYLTRPLILSQTQSKIDMIKGALLISLGSMYKPGFRLSFVASSLPPSPIFSACIVCGLPWAHWMSLLGGRDFTLVIDPHTVSVVYPGANAQRVLIWSELGFTPARNSPLARVTFDEPQVPISKLVQQQQQASTAVASLRATLSSAEARAQKRTLAQELLESDEQEEADELFAMISRSILSPTPTTEKFVIEPQQQPILSVITTPTLPSPLSTSGSPVSTSSSSPESSRPSSRSSNFSNFSFSDDDESITSASSIASFDFLSTVTKQAPAFVPRQVQQRMAAASQPAISVDNAKKDVTKYLYQGGVSTVLTGGVMLGRGGSSPKPAAQLQSKPACEETPKYRAPIGTRSSFGKKQNESAAEKSWRRPARF